jgi:hypothetical protein
LQELRNGVVAIYLSTVEKVSFHHGALFFPPLWKEKCPVMERINVSIQMY